MRRDVTRKAPGGLPIDLGILSHTRWPSLSLAAMLGGLLLLALLLAQGVRANSHTAVLSALSLDEIGVPGFEAATTSYTHTVYDALNAPDEEITVAAVTDPEDDGTDGTPKAVIKPDDADADDTNGHQVSLAVGENTIEIVVTSAGEETTRTYMVKVTRVAASDASLMALSLADPDDSDANIPLSPDFDAGTEMYTASVANSVNMAAVTATPTHAGSPGATATVIPTSPLTLNVGENTIKVVVRAVDGTVKTYTVVVTKAASDDASLATLTVGAATLTPAFDANADPQPTSYTATVANDVSQVDVAATSTDAEAEDPVIRPADADNVAGGHQVNLAVGDNTITVMVEAEDGSMATYTVVVTRNAAVSSDAVLSDLSLAQTNEAGTPVDLMPSFTASTTSYTATVYDALNAPVDKVAVTAGVTDPVERVISPSDADAATDGHQVNLRVGETTIRTRVTVSGATQDYTIKVTRVAASDVSLGSLSLADPDDSDANIPLMPAFDAGTEMYTASVANSVANTTVTATPTHAGTPGATATVIQAEGGALSVGENTIKVVVRAVDGTVKTYTVTVTRAGSAATLTVLTLADTGGANIELDPVFDAAADPMVYEHTAEAANSVARVTVTATKAATAEDPVINPADADAASMDTHEVDLMVGKNIIEVMVEAEDGSMNTFTITVTRDGSTDATLSALSLSGIDLDIDGDQVATSDPSADAVAAATSIMVTVPRHVDSTTVMATATDTAASVEYMPADADMAMKGHQVALGLGNTEIKVMVTSSDMTTTSTYTVTVNRRHADASLKSLSLGDDVTLMPTFDAGTMSYTASVAASEQPVEVTVTAAPTDAAATVVIAPTSPVTLAAGENTITVTVTSSDGTAQHVYTVEVFQVHATAQLTELSLGDDVALSPAFAAATTSYTANVPYETMQVTVAGTPVTGASMAVQDADGMAIEEADGYQVNLDLGANTIVVAVTGGDPAVTTTYTVVVTRGHSTDATLSELRLSGVMLNPVFDAVTTSYSANVANDVASTTVRATAAHADATVDAPGQVDLVEGANSIVVTVTAADGATTMTYTVVVARAVVEIVTVVGPGVTVSPLAALIEGETGSFNVRLTEEPSADVSIAVSSSDTAVVTVNGADAGTGVLTLTFTATDYMSSQTVMVMGAVDDDTEHARATISLAVTSADMDYQGLDKTVAVFVADNTAPVEVPVAEGVASLVVSSLASVKEGESGSITVRLNTAPTAAVTVAVSSDNTDVTVEPMSLTFTVDDFATAQTVAVAAAEDDDPDHGSAVISLVASSTDTDYEGLDKTVTVFVADNDPVEIEVEVEVEVEVPGPTVTETVTVPGPTRTRTVTETVTVEVPAPAESNVVGSTSAATATEVNGQVVITRHDGGPSLVVDLGGFIRDASLGQTYQVVRRMDGMIVRQWVSPNSPLVYQIDWAVVNSQFSVPVGVVGAIPLDALSGTPGQLVRRFDGGDDRIFSYDGMGGWRHVPDIPTFQALGLYWCDVTAADAGFFDRITIGAPHPATDQPARDDYPTCSTG